MTLAGTAAGLAGGLADTALQGLGKRPRTLRIGLTGLARAGKTALLTSLAANLLALGDGQLVLPALIDKLAGRSFRARLAQSGAESLPRFDALGHLAAMIEDPPHWPKRTEAASLLALDLAIGRQGIAANLPPRRIRLEILDYPGEWLLDLPLLRQDFATWSRAALARLEAPEAAAIARPFLAFAHALPAGAEADEALARQGHLLYRTALHALRDQCGLSLLQPGRFLIPRDGAEPPWMQFFPLHTGDGRGGLTRLLARRFDAYTDAARADLLAPGFGQIEGLMIAADLLTALATGPAAFADASTALAEAVNALHWRRDWGSTLSALARFRLPPPPIRRVAFVATKADHVAERQRGNLARLMGTLTATPQAAGLPVLATAIAAVRCTEDFIWTLDGKPVSAVRGRIPSAEGGQIARSWPGEVPDKPPGPDFFAHPFLRLPDFEPVRPSKGGGVPQLGLGALAAFLLEDVL